MPGLLDGGLARIMGAAFGSTYLSATLHRALPAVRDAGGSVTNAGQFADMPCRAMFELVAEELNVRDNVVDQAQRIFVLAASLTGPITPADQITLAGQRYQVVSVDRDPALAYWDLRGRLA
jgi:hypothetical protein